MRNQRNNHKTKRNQQLRRRVMVNNPMKKVENQKVMPLKKLSQKTQ
jgi:hypothetical protein